MESGNHTRRDFELEQRLELERAFGCASIIQPPDTITDLSAMAGLALRGAHIIEVLNPFRPDENSRIPVDPLDNESVGALLDRYSFDAQRYAVSLNGHRIAADELWSTAVTSDSEIVLFPRAEGGSWKGMLGMIAGMIAIGALLYFCPVILAAGSWVVGALFSAGAAIGSAVMSWALSPGQPGSADYSTTYDPTGPKSLAQAGTPVPKGYGTMGWGGNCISSYVSYAGKNAYINGLWCFGWGKGKSLTNILINKKAISTYSNCSYFVRLGSNDQEPIDGFNKTVNGYPQEVELLVSNGAVVVAGTGTGVEGLELTIKLPSGLYHISHNGNYVPINVTYKIEVAAHGTSSWSAPLFPRNYGSITTTHTDGSVTWPTWVVIPTDRFKGSGICYAHDNGSHTPGDKWTQTNNVDVYDMYGNESTVTQQFTGEWQLCDANLGLEQVTGWWKGYRVLKGDDVNPFFDTVQLYGLDAGQWDVRVTKIGYQEPGQDFVFADSTDSHYVTDIWLWNINEVTFSDLAYPNMILVGIHALATSQLSGTAIQIQATVTHDIGEDTVIPDELSSFEHDNPAIVAYDVLTNDLYGMGIAADLIDVPAFVAWAEFCDESVTNQDGSTVRRFIFSGVFDQTSDAHKTLQTIGNMSRAEVFQIGRRYSVVIDAPADPVQLFTVGNTKRDSFQEMWVALDDRCTLIECDFADAARNYRMDLPVSVITASDMNSGTQPNVSRIKLIGCTSRDQAWRHAYFQLMSTKLTLRSVQLSVPVEAVSCRKGSVIAIQSDITQWATGGRIQAGSSLTTVAIDRNDITYADGAGWTVSVQHPVILRGARNVMAISGKTITMTDTLPSGRIVKAVGPDGTEYIVTGYSGSAVTLASLTPQAATVALAVGQSVALYDLNVMEDILVTGWTATDSGGTLSIAPNTFAGVPTQDSAWAYGQSLGFQPAKRFRVTSIKRSGDFNLEIGGTEYNALMYEDAIPQYGEIVGTPDVDATITNLTLTEVYQNGLATGSTQSSLVAVGWMPGNTAVGGLVETQTSGSTDWKIVANVAKGSGCTFTGTAGVTYTVRVYPIDAAGNLGSTPATASITVVSGTNAPADVPFLAGSLPSTGVGMILAWPAVAAADHYEVRCIDGGTDWTTAEVLWTGTTTTWADTASRNGVYMIKAVSSPATGSVESNNAVTYQYGQLQDRPFTGANLTVTASGTSIAITLPAQTLTDTTDGISLTTTASQTLTFTGLTAGVNYYFYLYLDYPELALESVIAPGSIPDTVSNNGNSLAARESSICVFGQLEVNSTTGIVSRYPRGTPISPQRGIVSST